MNDVLGWVCRNQYDSAIWKELINIDLFMVSTLITYPLGIDFGIWDLPVIFLGLLGINDAVNDGMRDMNTLRAEFAREGL